MEERLSDEEFKELIKIRYDNKAKVIGNWWDTLELETTLINKGLAKLKKVTTHINRNRNVYEGFILICTEPGKLALEKEPLRVALTLADLGLYNGLHEIISRIPRDQLPALLSHSNWPVRLAAKTRFESLHY